MGDQEAEASTKAILEASRFWVQKVSVPVFVILGLVGNIITVMVLTRKRMRNSTNIYLTALAIADIIYLVFGLFLSFQHYDIHAVKYELYWKCYGLMNWLFDAASATSSWLAVSFTVERYIAVCYPMKGRLFCTERKAKNVITFIYILCTLTTASRNFEYTLSGTEKCTRNCSAGETPPDKQTKNVTNPNNVTFHTINVTYDSRITDPTALDASFQSQLKNILDNCTTHPHVIYVPIYLKPSDVGTQNNTASPSYGSANFGALPTTALQTAEHVLEKPIRALEENKTILEENTEERNSSTLANKTDGNTIDNVTCCVNAFSVTVVETKFGQNPTYKNFRNWYSAVVLIIIPFVLIAIFNSLLLRAVYLSQRMRRVMTNSQDNTSYNSDKRITNMLIAIVIIFLICNTPNASHSIYYDFYEPITPVELNICKILGNFFNLLVMINAPCNFIIYCLLSKKFRSTFKQIFWDRRKPNKQIETETILLSRMKSSNKFNPYKHGLMKQNSSEYRTPRNLETQSLTSIPRTRSLIARPIGKAKSTDIVV